MHTKVFIVLLLGTMIFGGSLAGSFIIGQIVGKNQAASGSVVVQTLPAPSSLRQEASTSSIPDAQAIEELRERFRSGDLSQEEMIALRDRFQPQFAETGEVRQFQGSGIGRPAITGTITTLDDNVLSLETGQGILEVSLDENVTITKTLEVEIQELTNGMRLSLIGERTEDGRIGASIIQIIPEGMDLPLGEGLRRSGGRRSDTLPAPIEVDATDRTDASSN